MKNSIYIFCYFITLIYTPLDKYNSPLRITTTLIFGLYVVYIYSITKSPMKVLSVNKNLHIYVLVILLTIGAIRSNMPGSSLLGQISKIIQLFVFMAASILAVNQYLVKNKDIGKLIFNFVLLPFLLYFSLNLVLFILGVSFGNTESMSPAPAVFLSNFGISINRVKFPLSTGMNSFAAVIGGIFTVLLMNYKYGNTSKIVSLIYIVILSTILILIDSRAAIIYPFIVILFVFIANKNPNTLKILPIVSIIAPLLFGSLLIILADVDFVQSLSRSEEDMSTGNSRTIIWAIASSEFMNFDINHLIGYGEYGHYKSGASLEWASIFTSFDNSDIMHPHNSILVVLFDYGYLGLVIYLYVIYKMINNCIKTWDLYRKFNYMVVSYIIYFILIGITESYFGFYYLNSCYILLSFLIIQNSVCNKKLFYIAHVSSNKVSQIVMNNTLTN